MWCIKRPSQDWFLFGKRLNLQPVDQTASCQSAVPPLAHSRPPPTSSLNLAHSRRALQCCGHAGPPSHNSQSFPLAWETSGCWNCTVLWVWHRLLYSFQLTVIKKKKKIILFYSLNALLKQTLCVSLHFLWQDATVDSVKDAWSKGSIGLAGSHEQLCPSWFFSIFLFNYDSSSSMR